MGFFSGGKSTSKTGFHALPFELRNMVREYSEGVDRFVSPTGANSKGNISRFTPMAQSADETRAFDLLRKGFSPTHQSLASDIQMQMNPYNQSVIDGINREAGGQYSILKQSLNEAGQMGSNRQMLGANDIDLSRQQQIGSFLQGQHNTAMQNALTVLPQLRAADAQGLMGIGEFQRNLELARKQAPVTALQAAVGLGQGMGVSSAVGSTTKTTQKSGGLGSSLLGGLGNIGGMLSGIGGVFGGGSGVADNAGAPAGAAGGGLMSFLGFSDRRLKENIEEAGMENGHKIYSFNYMGDNKKFIGVMADEVEKTNPEAIKEVRGFKAVDYDKIGVVFREA
jgi:hypothetical protein